MPKLHVKGFEVGSKECFGMAQFAEEVFKQMSNQFDNGMMRWIKWNVDNDTIPSIFDGEVVHTRSAATGRCDGQKYSYLCTTVSNNGKALFHVCGVLLENCNFVYSDEVFSDNELQSKSPAELIEKRMRSGYFDQMQKDAFNPTTH